MPKQKYKIKPGDRFGKFTAIELCKIDGRIKWKCVCECGNYLYKQASHLYNITGNGCKYCGKNEFKEWEKALVRLTYAEFGARKLTKILNRSAATIEQWARNNGLRRQTIFPNQVFGKLMVIKLDSIQKGIGKIFLCKCKCGKEILIQGNKLNSGDNRSCGCSKIVRQNVGNIPGSWYGYCVKSNANRRMINFDISIEFLDSLWNLQTGKCYYTNWPINLYKEKGEVTGSLDRIDSKKDYLEENVRFVHKDINLMKNYFEETYFLKMCEAVYKNTLKEYDERTNDWW